MIQGSEEWFAARVGKVTASRVSDVIARTKTGWGASRANYMAELIAERLTGNPAERFQNKEMQWGTDTEPHARSAYEFFADVDVEIASFVEHPSIPLSGASPDGFVGADGLLEIKCPNTATHIDTLLGGSVPSKYVCQMQWQMACTGRKWCDFVSFDPRMPQSMCLFIRRVVRDDTQIESLQKGVTLFLAEIETKLSALRDLYQRREAA